MKLTSNSLQSISNSNNLRMGLSYAKESHALFFERFSSHCAERIKDVFFVEKGTSITEAHQRTAIFLLLQAEKTWHTSIMLATGPKDVSQLVLLAQILVM